MSTADLAAAARLRSVFLDAGFTADGLLALLGPSAYAALGRGEPVPARRMLAGRTGADVVLAHLFVLGDAVPRDDVAQHLPLEDLLDLGLVGGGAELRAAVDVQPCGRPDTDWYVVSDHGPDSSGHTVPEVAVDHVLGVGGASLTLARITPRAQVDRALDLARAAASRRCIWAARARDRRDRPQPAGAAPRVAVGSALGARSGTCARGRCSSRSAASGSTSSSRTRRS